MRSGRRSSVSWTICLNKQGMSMLISRCWFPNLFSLRKPIMLRGLQKNVLLWRIIAWKMTRTEEELLSIRQQNWKKSISFVRLRRPSSGILIKTGYNPIGICRFCVISGLMWCVGKCVPGCFCVRLNFCGRKDIQPMLRKKRRWKRPIRWWGCMPILHKIGWLFPSLWARRVRASGLQVPWKPLRLKRWCRMEKLYKPELPTSSDRILPKLSMYSSPMLRENSNTCGQLRGGYRPVWWVPWSWLIRMITVWYCLRN